MKILVVSGFLGAGKTTFIKELIKRTSLDLTVLENEYGENSLDSGELKGADKSSDVLEFMEGCVCCTKKDAFVNTLLSISSAVDPEYLVVEPTGIGKLGNIIANIKKIEYDRISLLPTVVVLNPSSIEDYISEYPDIYENQIKFADTVVFSKCENADPAFLDMAEKKIRELNPDCDIIKNHYSGMDDGWFHKILETEEGSKHASRVTDEDLLSSAPDIDQITVKDASLDAPSLLIVLLEDVLHGVYGDIPRAKGIVKIGEEYVRFDVADGMYGIISEYGEQAEGQDDGQNDGQDENALKATSDENEIKNAKQNGSPKTVATFIGRGLDAPGLMMKLQHSTDSFLFPGNGGRF